MSSSGGSPITLRLSPERRASSISRADGSGIQGDSRSSQAIAPLPELPSPVVVRGVGASRLPAPRATRRARPPPAVLAFLTSPSPHSHSYRAWSPAWGAQPTLWPMPATINAQPTPHPDQTCTRSSCRPSTAATTPTTSSSDYPTRVAIRDRQRHTLYAPRAFWLCRAIVGLTALSAPQVAATVAQLRQPDPRGRRREQPRVPPGRPGSGCADQARCRIGSWG